MGSHARGVTHYGPVSEIAGPVDRVVIVGAGIAGLAAASRLTAAGIDCMVLEARDRIGGRLHTIDLAGTPVDLGGSWIHHPIGNPMSALCDQLDVGRDPGDPMPSLSGYDQTEGRRLDHDEIARYCEVEADAFWDALEVLGERLGPDATAHDAIEAHIAERELTGADARRTRQELRAEVEADAPGPVGDQSLTWLAMDEEFEGDLFGDLPRGGYASVITALAPGIDVRLNTEVMSIEVEEHGVRVACSDGSVEFSSHAIVTVPLGVLKRGSPRFDPTAARGGAACGGEARLRSLREDRAAVREAVLARRGGIAPGGVPAKRKTSRRCGSSISMRSARVRCCARICSIH